MQTRGKIEEYRPSGTVYISSILVLKETAKRKLDLNNNIYTEIEI